MSSFQALKTQMLTLMTTMIYQRVFIVASSVCRRRNGASGRTCSYHSGVWCAGSSRDWLFLLDKNNFPSLFNPSSAITIHLPIFSVEFFPSVSYFHCDPYLLKILVSKAVLMPSPSPSQYTLVIIYGYLSKLAFCTERGTWLQLGDAKRRYRDIVFLDDVLYGLTEDGFVEGWNIGNNQLIPPTRVFNAKPTMEIDEEDKQFSIDLFSTQIYLVILEGEFLLVKRYIGNFVNADGLVVYEGYSDDDNEICPYRTKHFVTYKLDITKVNWEKKKCLHDKVLFVGANESTSLPAKASSSGCEANSIYFTDDRWEEMGLDYLYGGHDWGVFSLHDGSVKLLTPNVFNIDPPPI